MVPPIGLARKLIHLHFSMKTSMPNTSILCSIRTCALLLIFPYRSSKK